MSEPIDDSVRSELVRDYLDRVPHWLIQSGMYITGMVLLVLIILSMTIRYPTLVKADFRLTASSTFKPVLVKENGRLEKLFVKESQKVNRNEILGWIESTANHAEVLKLEQELNQISDMVIAKEYHRISQARLSEFNSLGEIQIVYQDFRNSHIQVIVYYGNDFYKRKRDLLDQEIGQLAVLQTALEGQLKLFQKDVALAQKELEMNRKLFSEKVISALDLDREESKVLAKLVPIKNMELKVAETTNLMHMKRDEILDLDKKVFEDTERFAQSLNVLRSAIANWKNRFLLIAPATGLVHFTEAIQVNQHVKQNTEFCFVGDDTEDFFGEIQIPQNNFGKVRIGQRVIIKFQGYPFEEFGSREGVVSNIAARPTLSGNTYYATVTLDDPKQQEQKNQKFQFRDGMLAAAEIVTEDMSLAERIFYDIRRITSSR